ncbi:hypothetical protein QUF84_00630 [Fictibacillus enclensis]|uniref:hypothetical protein n=1 Tax=Fictibacillus enclensis TaxID=1017270 RepID=UPI0025A0898D|nr:hypothetical protein [Fictibacillus enclensis]MDM5335802.1 hypothetical protein [Fictibacillus enclensis]
MSKRPAPETKVVKINADLHYKLKLYAALEGNVTITDLINAAVKDYILKTDIENIIKSR